MSNGGTHSFAKAGNSKGATISPPNATSSTAPTYQFNANGSTSKPSLASIYTSGSFPKGSYRVIGQAAKTPATTTPTTAAAPWSNRHPGRTVPPTTKPPAMTLAVTTTGASSPTASPATTKSVAPGPIVITPTPSSTAPIASSGKSFVPLSPTTGVFGSGSAAAGASPVTATIGTLFGTPTTSAAAATGKLFGAPSTSTASTTTSGGLFGPPATPAATTSGGLFGASAASTVTSSGGLFGAPATSTTITSGGLFGQHATTTATSSGSLFGVPATSTTTTSGGLFGNPATPSSGGLIGTPTTAATPGSLFGVAPAPKYLASIFEASSTNTTTGGQFVPPATSSRSQTAHSAMSLTFRLSWPVSGTKGGEGHKVLIKTKDGNFEFVCTVREVTGLHISLTANNPDHFRRLGMFKGAVIQDMQKASTVYAPLSQLPFTYTLSYYFHLGGLTPKDDVYEADIMLTNQTATTVQTDPAYHCETLLELLLQDSASHDVFFEFEVTEDASTLNTVTRWLTPRSEEKQSSDESDTEASDGSSADGERTKAGGQKDTGKGKGFSSSKAAQLVMLALESTENVSNPTIKGKQVSRTVTVGAHISVLSQYKYFKSTYFSPSIDRSVEKKVIKILEEEVAVFRLLLHFLYLGQLKPRTSPLFVTRDILAQDSRGVPTWEDVFLAAHRYEVFGLAVLAAEKIVANLDSQWAIPFLFRTGYKFANLRHDVIRFVVANNMPQVVQKELQQTYQTHPGCSAIFGEIMAEMWNVLNRASASPLAAGSGPTFGVVSLTTPSTIAATAASPATAGPVHFAPGAPVTPSSIFFAGTATTTSTAGSPFKAPATNAAPSLPIFNPVTSVSLSSIGVATVATTGSSSTVPASPVPFATPSTPPQKRE